MNKKSPSKSVGGNPTRYGSHYFGVRLETGEELYFHADYVSTENGYFCAWRKSEGEWKLNLSGKYTVLYAAEIFAGCAMAVEHWDELSTK